MLYATLYNWSCSHVAVMHIPANFVYTWFIKYIYRVVRLCAAIFPVEK